MHLLFGEFTATFESSKTKSMIAKTLLFYFSSGSYWLFHFLMYFFSFLFLFSSFAVQVSLQNATIFVNFSFLFLLLEFITIPPSDVNHPREPQVSVVSQTSLDASGVRDPETPREGRDAQIHRTESGDVTSTDAPSQVDAAASPTQETQLKIVVHGVVEDPNIVLLSDATNKESEALIVQVIGFWSLFLSILIFM